MKGIVGDLLEMKIPLKTNANLVKQRPHSLNPVYKKKVKGKIYTMLEAVSIEPVSESEWIRQMVIQNEKT
jgi:hypothetical protein